MTTISESAQELQRIADCMANATYFLRSKPKPDGSGAEDGIAERFANELENPSMVIRFERSKEDPNFGRGVKIGFFVWDGSVETLYSFIKKKRYGNQAIAFHEYIKAGSRRRLMFDVDGLNVPRDEIIDYVEKLAEAVSHAVRSLEIEDSPMTKDCYTVCVSDDGEECKGFHIVFHALWMFRRATIVKIYAKVTEYLAADETQHGKRLTQEGVLDAKPASEEFSMRLMASYKVVDTVLQPRQKMPLDDLQYKEDYPEYFLRMLICPPRSSSYFTAEYDDDEVQEETSAPTTSDAEVRELLAMSEGFKGWTIGGVSRIGYRINNPKQAWHDCKACGRRHDKTHTMIVGRGLRVKGAAVQIICTQGMPGKRTIEVLHRRDYLKTQPKPEDANPAIEPLLAKFGCTRDKLVYSVETARGTPFYAQDLLLSEASTEACGVCNVVHRTLDHLYLSGRGLVGSEMPLELRCRHKFEKNAIHKVLGVTSRESEPSPEEPKPVPELGEYKYPFSVANYVGKRTDEGLRRHFKLQAQDHVIRGTAELKAVARAQCEALAVAEPVVEPVIEAVVQPIVEPVVEPEPEFVIPGKPKRGRRAVAQPAVEPVVAPVCDKEAKKLAKEAEKKAARAQREAERLAKAAAREAAVQRERAVKRQEEEHKAKVRAINDVCDAGIAALKLAVRADMEAHIAHYMAVERYERAYEAYEKAVAQYQEADESGIVKDFKRLRAAIFNVERSGVKLDTYAGIDFEKLHERTFTDEEDLVSAIHATLRVHSTGAFIVKRGAWTEYDFRFGDYVALRNAYVFKIKGSGAVYSGKDFWKTVRKAYVTTDMNYFRPYESNESLTSRLGDGLNTFTGLRGTGLPPFVDEATSERDVKAFIYLLENQLATEGPEYSEYLLNWLSWVVQRPRNKTGVAVLIHGRPGTGKSMLFSLLKAIVPHAGINPNKGLTTLTDRFNSDVEGKVLYMIGEAPERLQEDAAATATLKALITDDTLVVEQKGKDVRVIPQYLNVLMASNNVNCIQTSVGDRRWCMMYNPNPVHVFGDNEYFEGIWKLVDSNSFKANIQHYLATRDISKFTPQDYPRSFALRATKLSVSPILDFALNTSTLRDLLTAQIGEVKRPYRLRDIVLAYEAQELPRFPNYQRLENELYNGLMNCAQLRDRFVMHPDAIDDRLIYDGETVVNPIQFVDDATVVTKPTTPTADTLMIAQMIEQLRALGADVSRYEVAFPTAVSNNYAIQTLAWLRNECKTRDLGSTRNLPRAKLIEMLQANDAQKTQ